MVISSLSASGPVVDWSKTSNISSWKSLLRPDCGSPFQGLVCEKGNDVSDAEAVRGKGTGLELKDQVALCKKASTTPLAAIIAMQLGDPGVRRGVWDRSLREMLCCASLVQLLQVLGVAK